MERIMSCRRFHMVVVLGGIIFPLVTSAMSDGAFFVILNHSGRDLEAECGDMSWTISVGERTVITAAPDGGLEVLGPSTVFRSIRQHPHRHQASCRVEAGNCFLAWDPLKGSRSHVASGIGGSGDHDWEVDETGVSSRSESTTGKNDAGSTSSDEYEMVWQPTSPLLSGAAQCMCAPTSSPFAQAFYSVLLYFRE